MFAKFLQQITLAMGSEGEDEESQRKETQGRRGKEADRNVQSRWKGYSGLQRGRRVVFQGTSGSSPTRLFSKRYLREKKGIKKENTIIQKRKGRIRVRQERTG